jgi:hypothetical protein
MSNFNNNYLVLSVLESFLISNNNEVTRQKQIWTTNDDQSNNEGNMKSKVE